MDARIRSIPLAGVMALALGVAAPAAAPRPAPAPLVQLVAVAHRPVAIVVLPGIRRVATVDATGTLDIFDTSLHLVATLSVCPEARWLTGDDRHGRLFVGCHNATLPPGDDRGELAVVAVRARAVIDRLRGIATLTIAAVDASERGLVYVRLAGGKVARYDAGTRRVIDAIVLDGAPGDRLRFVPGNAATPMIALDRDADRIYPIEPDGTVHPVAIGRRRYPSDAALDGRRLAVALAGAGTVDFIDLARPDDHHIVPAVESPMAVAFGRGGQILALGERSTDLAVVSVDERTDAHVIGIIPRTDVAPYPLDTTQTAMDFATGRLVVATTRRIDVVDTGAGSFSMDLLHSMTITGMTLDAASGDAYVAIGDESRGAIARMPVRGTRPRSPFVARDRAFGLGESAGAYVFALAQNDDTRIAVDPPGLRSPAQLAVRPEGALTVAHLLSPTLGTFALGTYREQPLASRAPPRALAYGPDGLLWFSESTTDRGIVARRDREGAIAEFPLPARADKIAVADDGLYWLARYPRQLFGRVAADGMVVVRTPELPEAPEGQRWLVDIAPAPGGGCYVLYTDKLVLVRPDGSTKIYPDVPAGLGFGHATAVAALPTGGVAFAVDHVVVRQERNGARHLYWPLPREAPLERLRSTCSISELTGRSDGSVWGVCGERIFGVTKSGLVRTVIPPVPQSNPQSLVEAPDGSMWFAEPTHSALGRIAPDGTLTEVSL